MMARWWAAFGFSTERQMSRQSVYSLLFVRKASNRTINNPSFKRADVRFVPFALDGCHVREGCQQLVSDTFDFVFLFFCLKCCPEFRGPTKVLIVCDTFCEFVDSTELMVPPAQVHSNPGRNQQKRATAAYLEPDERRPVDWGGLESVRVRVGLRFRYKQRG